MTFDSCVLCAEIYDKTECRCKFSKGPIEYDHVTNSSIVLDINNELKNFNA